MARTDTLGNFLTDVADAIREKKGTTNTIPVSNFDSEIASIEGGGKYAPKYISFYLYDGNSLQDEINNLDTSNIKNMQYMFSGCTSLLSVDLSKWDTSNVTMMNYMFRNCKCFQRLDLSNFNTSKVTNMNFMFNGCTGLTYLDIRNFDFTNVSSHTNMFTNVPTNCEIIVKDDTAKTWITTNFTTLTNVKTVAELGGTE